MKDEIFYEIEHSYLICGAGVMPCKALKIGYITEKTVCHIKNHVKKVNFHNLLIKIFQKVFEVSKKLKV